jgi:hypothetical protein
MRAHTLAAAPLATIQRQFTDHWPRIRNIAQYAFRRSPPQQREDAIAETCACAWKAWIGLARRGRDPIALGVTGLAWFAVRHTRRGRRVGNLRRGGRHGRDLCDPRVQQAGGLCIRSYEAGGRPPHCRSATSWRAWLATDPRYGPADEAAFRVDFAQWLAALPARKQQLVALLAVGHPPGAVARLWRVGPSAISEQRAWLAHSWHRFQGEELAPTATARGRGPSRAPTACRGAPCAATRPTRGDRCHDGIGSRVTDRETPS